MNNQVTKFLSMIGVDIRYISIYNKLIFINNLKFSKFSHRREDLFLAKHPEYKVIRSKTFQKMCIKASRILSKSLNPRDKVLIIKNKNCADLLLYLILEPYQRKYGIQIITTENPNLKNDYKMNSIASPLTLDQEVINIIKQIFGGKKIEQKSINIKKKDTKIIYPLINIPEAWIEKWAEKDHLQCSNPPLDHETESLLKFLEHYIPDVRENMLKSAMYLSK